MRSSREKVYSAMYGKATRISLTNIPIPPKAKKYMPEEKKRLNEASLIQKSFMVSVIAECEAFIKLPNNVCLPLLLRI